MFRKSKGKPGDYGKVRVRLNVKNSVLKVINTKRHAEIGKSSAMRKEKEIPRTVATMNVLILEHL